MALNISHFNIKPDVDAYALAYRAEMNRRKPWIDMMKDLSKIATNASEAYVRSGDPKTTEDPEVTVEDGDASLTMNGLDPFLYRRMLSKEVKKPENLGLINPFTRKEW